MVRKRKKKRRPREDRRRRPVLYIGQIVAWAKAFHEKKGRWPTLDSGRVPGRTETWNNLDSALRRGDRGLPGGSTLRKLLAEQLGVRNEKDLDDVSIEQILTWADAHHARTGEWPDCHAGPVVDAEGETWSGLDHALNRGRRGLPVDSSLAKVFAEHRGVRHHLILPRLTEEQILAWADAHYQRTGQWPKLTSGAIAAAAGAETWMGMHMALDQGHRGLPGGSTLAQLLEAHRGVRNLKNLPPLSEKQILQWAEGYHQRHGKWPGSKSGPIPEAPGETWSAIENALRAGRRGLPGGSTLARLLVERRGARPVRNLPSLTVAQILAWARKHRQRTGELPTANSGPIPEEPNLTWRALDHALRRGRRGLPAGQTLYQFLAQEHADPDAEPET